MAQTTQQFGNNGERVLDRAGTRLVLFYKLPGLFEPLFSNLQSGVLYNTCLPEQVDELG